MTERDESGLLEAFADVVEAEAESRRLRERVASQRRAFESWCAEAEDAVMVELTRALERRARAIEAALGVTVDVTYPSHRPVATDGGERMHFLRVAFAGSELHVYTTRSIRGLPSLHFAYAVRSARARFSRLLSVPGYVLSRTPEGATCLRRAAGAATESGTSIDAVAIRILQMLAGAARTRVTRAVA